MDYKEHFKKEVQNFIFVELEKPLVISLNNVVINLPKGDYPVDFKELINVAKENKDFTAQSIINGMIFVLGADSSFPYLENYINILKKIPNIESYIIFQIEENKNKDIKKAIIYTSALIKLNPKKEFQMNRIYLLMDYYQKTNLSFLEAEIIESLKNLLKQYPEYEPANFYIAEYYLDKDIDLAKYHLRYCLSSEKYRQKAEEYLKKIEAVENYDKAVSLLKEGYPKEALKILIPYIESNPQNLDAKYYIAVAYREIGNYQKALLYLNELLNILETPEVDNEIGLNLAFLGYFEKAIEYFKKALKFKPSEVSILSNIGVCYFNLNDFENAKKYFKLALDKKPDDEVCKEWIRRLS
ncbi:Tetratricopeptide repeat-containing protein [Caloramator fervidus]|uniref:Tetratricopeptide repeat-containing protein n=1 Tax=Caloramator fervidus TaxID=29344 RepID=A0A1H5T0A2_9CLOT|nr:tetratricopeptide repeat protein [Caloramator fervidus]SEF56220.1 Tetratricopeptide repeat-containing protein [Caloramator fervidus]